MRGCRDLGLVDTIYEDDHEDCSVSASPSLSPTVSSASTPLQSTVEAWTLAWGRNADVFIYVQGTCFHLHKDPLVAKSGFLKRHFTNVSEKILVLSLNITVETFAAVVHFCYDNQVVITAFNVAALRTAAELLEMTELNTRGDNNLQQITEAYFCRAIAVSKDYASIVFRSCLNLLPEAEETASLVSRCVEALSSVDKDDVAFSDANGFKTVCAEDLQTITNSMHSKFAETHDLLYRIVDLYLKEQSEKITDEQRNRICNCIDCNKLSPQLLLHAVQNPRMPIRFLVRAMLVDQLNTRRSNIFYAAEPLPPPRHSRDTDQDPVSTLGAILQRDAALRQVEQLKAAMDATSSRIKSLEKDLSGMRKLLHESETRRNEMESGRSASFRLASAANKIERGERGSTSSISLGRFSRIGEREEGGSSSSDGSHNVSFRSERNLGRRLINGLKNAFRLSSNSATKHDHKESRVSGKVHGDAVGEGEQDGHGDIVVIRNVQASHRRSRSVV